MFESRARRRRGRLTLYLVACAIAAGLLYGAYRHASVTHAQTLLAKFVHPVMYDPVLLAIDRKTPGIDPVEFMVVRGRLREPNGFFNSDLTTDPEKLAIIDRSYTHGGAPVWWTPLRATDELRTEHVNGARVLYRRVADSDRMMIVIAWF